jgi:hypothetical protein
MKGELAADMELAEIGECRPPPGGAGPCIDLLVERRVCDPPCIETGRPAEVRPQRQGDAVDARPELDDPQSGPFRQRDEADGVKFQ